MSSFLCFRCGAAEDDEARTKKRRRKRKSATVEVIKENGLEEAAPLSEEAKAEVNGGIGRSSSPLPPILIRESAKLPVEQSAAAVAQESAEVVASQGIQQSPNVVITDSTLSNVPDVSVDEFVQDDVHVTVQQQQALTNVHVAAPTPPTSESSVASPPGAVPSETFQSAANTAHPSPPTSQASLVDEEEFKQANKREVGQYI